MKVLRTIPFDKVDIRVLSIEVNKLDKSELTSFMAESGYRVLRDLKTDLIFVKQAVNCNCYRVVTYRIIEPTKIMDTELFTTLSILSKWDLFKTAIPVLIQQDKKPLENPLESQ